MREENIAEVANLRHACSRYASSVRAVALHETGARKTDTKPVTVTTPVVAVPPKSPASTEPATKSNGVEVPVGHPNSSPFIG